MGTWNVYSWNREQILWVVFKKSEFFARFEIRNHLNKNLLLSSGMLELQDDGVLGPAKEHPTAFRVELPQYSQQLRLLDAGER